MAQFRFDFSSMTGFGAADGSQGIVTIAVEARSVNAKGLDVQVRVPQEYSIFEPGIRKAVKASFRRGRIDLFVRRVVSVEAPESSARRLRVDFLRSLLAEMEEFCNVEKIKLPKKEALVLEVLGRSDIVEHLSSSAPLPEEEHLLHRVVSSAVEQLVNSRKQEGVALSEAMELHLTTMFGMLAELEEACEKIEQRLPEKLRDRMAKYELGTLDEQRVSQELAFLLERGDVSEELQRLRSHFEKLSSGPLYGGKELDFYCQELGRELSTLGAKTSGASTKHLLIAMRTELEKIREQAQNAE